MDTPYLFRASSSQHKHAERCGDERHKNWYHYSLRDSEGTDFQSSLLQATSIFPERDLLHSYIFVSVGVLAQLVHVEHQNVSLDL